MRKKIIRGKNNNINWNLGLFSKNKAKIRVKGNENNVTLNSKNCNKLAIKITGNNNYIFIEENCKFNNTTIFLDGDNNHLYIGSGNEFNKSEILFYKSDSRILFKEDNLLLHSTISINKGKTISIGRGCYLFHNSIRNENILGGNPSIIIGDNCMLGVKSVIQTSDYHASLDLKSRKIENYEKDIVLKEHVWIAENSKVQKGVTIAKDCTLASDSKATKDLKEEHCIYAGTPAKVVKRDRTWKR